MQLTLKFKDDIIALVDHALTLRGKAGKSKAETPLSKEATNNGGFIKSVRDWTGGKPSPTLALVHKLEDYIRSEIGEDEYQKFLKSRAKNKS
jgi:hypothetical protein